MELLTPLDGKVTMMKLKAGMEMRMEETMMMKQEALDLRSQKGAASPTKFLSPSAVKQAS